MMRNLAGSYFLIVATLCAGQREITSTWNELGPRVVDRNVSLVLPDGKRVKGKVRAVEPEGLRFQGRRGGRLIPRQSISTLEVTEYGKRGRILVTLGAVGTATAIVLANRPDLYEGLVIIIVPAVIAGGLIGIAIAGYYIGKRIDRRVTVIRIAP